MYSVIGVENNIVKFMGGYTATPVLSENEIYYFLRDLAGDKLRKDTGSDLWSLEEAVERVEVVLQEILTGSRAEWDSKA